jgi:hypothetical protein
MSRRPWSERLVVAAYLSRRSRARPSRVAWEGHVTAVVNFRSRRSDVAATDPPPETSSRSLRLSGPVIAIVDTGPLYAGADADDDDHAACVEVLERSELRLVVPALVVAEVTYMVGRRLGAKAEARFLRGMASLEI